MTTKLTDVAAAAGVSLGTASNAFNRPDLVRPELREKVKEAAKKLGYSGPDPTGRLLMGGKANAIAVLPPGDMAVAHAFRSPYFRDFVLGVAEICEENGASLLVISGAEDKKRWAIQNALVDGFILGHRDELELIAARQRKVPAVVMDMDAGPDASSIRIDGYKGAQLAARHLIELGHRHFAILATMRKPCPPIWHASARGLRLRHAYDLDQEKLRGYLDALKAAKIPLDDIAVVEGALSYPADAARLLLERLGAATAVLCMADRLAIPLLEEARSRAVAVPDRLSIVGFDDAPDARGSTPPLTTIRQMIAEKGRRAARMIFEGGAARRELMEVELVVRSSTASRREAAAT